MNNQAEAEVAAAAVKPRWGEEETDVHQPTLLGNKENHVALFVYPASREASVKPELLQIIEDNQGKMGSSAEADKIWQERFYPIRLKRLGPSLISSEAIVAVPVINLGQSVAEIERKFPEIAIDVTMLSHEQASILGHLLADERSPAYPFEFPRSLEIIDVACKFGGCLYSVGLYFTSFARRNLGGDKVRKLLDYKEKSDSSWLFNPGKIPGVAPLVAPQMFTYLENEAKKTG